MFLFLAVFLGQTLHVLLKVFTTALPTTFHSLILITRFLVFYREEIMPESPCKKYLEKRYSVSIFGNKQQIWGQSELDGPKIEITMMTSCSLLNGLY